MRLLQIGNDFLAIVNCRQGQVIFFTKIFLFFYGIRDGTVVIAICCGSNYIPEVVVLIAKEKAVRRLFGCQNEGSGVVVKVNHVLNLLYGV